MRRVVACQKAPANGMMRTGLVAIRPGQEAIFDPNLPSHVDKKAHNTTHAYRMWTPLNLMHGQRSSCYLLSFYNSKADTGPWGMPIHSLTWHKACFKKRGATRCCSSPYSRLYLQRAISVYTTYFYVLSRTQDEKHMALVSLYMAVAVRLWAVWELGLSSCSNVHKQQAVATGHWCTHINCWESQQTCCIIPFLSKINMPLCGSSKFSRLWRALCGLWGDSRGNSLSRQTETTKFAASTERHINFG